ncbi:hypothetical protein [Dactylosporangium cerinum]
MPPASTARARFRPRWTAHRTGDVPVRLARRWSRLASAAAGLAAAGSIAGLLAGHRIYGRETTVLADAAAAQDVVNLALVAPLLVVLGPPRSAGRCAPTSRGWAAWPSPSTTTPFTRSRCSSARCSCSGPRSSDWRRSRSSAAWRR